MTDTRTETERLADFRKNFGGPLSDQEVLFLEQIRSAAANVRDKNAFEFFVKLMCNDLKRLRPYKYDMAAARAAGWMPFVESLTGKDPDVASPQLEAVEADFLQDVIGLLEFALRNGIRFVVVLSVLGHDFFEIQAKGSLKAALEDFWYPKVSGWGEKNAASVGEPNTPEE